MRLGWVIIVSGVLAGCGSTRFSNRSNFMTVDPGDSRAISVMTANLHRNLRNADMRLLARNIQTDLHPAPDFVLCQEMMFSALGPSRSAAGVLADTLGFHWRGQPRSIGSVEGSAILSRHPFTYYDARRLKSSPSRWKLGFRRMSQMGEFEVPNVGRVRVVNVHFQDGLGKSANRAAQLLETLHWIDERDTQVPADVIILGGDFNAPPDATEFAGLMSDTRQMRFENFNTQRLSKFAKHTVTPTLRLDNIYVASRKRLIDFLGEELLWTDGLNDARGARRHISDHLMMMHTYRVTFPKRWGATPWLRRSLATRD